MKNMAMGAKASNAPQSLKACVPHTLKLSTGGGDVTLKVNGGGAAGTPASSTVSPRSQIN